MLRLTKITSTSPQKPSPSGGLIANHLETSVVIQNPGLAFDSRPRNYHQNNGVLKFDVACNCLSSTARFIHVDFTQRNYGVQLNRGRRGTQLESTPAKLYCLAGVHSQP